LNIAHRVSRVAHRDIRIEGRTYTVRLDPQADTGALTPSADWIKCCFSKNFLEVSSKNNTLPNQRSVSKRQCLHEDPGLGSKRERYRVR